MGLAKKEVSHAKSAVPWETSDSAESKTASVPEEVYLVLPSDRTFVTK